MAPTLAETIALAQDLVARGRFGEARARLARALREHPSHPVANLQLGRVLHLAGRAAEAEPYFQTAIEHAPGMLAAVVGLTRVWRETGRTEEASALLKRCLVQAPDTVPLIAELAGLSFAQWIFQTTIDWNRRLLCLDPDNRTAHPNIAEALSMLQRDDEALAHIEEALRHDPNAAQLRLNRAMSLLSVGRYREGWEAYEARLSPKIEDAPKRLIDIPRWRGEPISNMHILVCSEQGLGDQFFFGAYLPRLRALAGRISIETDPRLVPLLQRSFPDFSVYPYRRRLSGRRPIFSYGWLPRDRDRPDVYTDLASLPFQLGEDHEEAVSPHGYLTADDSAVQHWRQTLAALADGQPVVGIFWRSGLMTAERARFYPTIEHWGPVLTCPGVRFLSLQFDDDSEDIETAARLFGVRILKPVDIDLRDDLDQAAALYRTLTGVVAPSTTTATMAAALGTRTMIVTSAPDWTPLIDGRDAILNATLRLRPPRLADWEWVFRRARQHMEDWLASGVG